MNQKQTKTNFLFHRFRQETTFRQKRYNKQKYVSARGEATGSERSRAAERETDQSQAPGNTVHSGNSAVILGEYHKQQQQQHTSQLPAA